jgi:Tol biopolymer transport system component
LTWRWIACGAAALALINAPFAAAFTFGGTNGKIAFERGNDTAEHDVYAVDPDGSHELNLTHNGSNNRQIAWAPDGSQVAFFSDGDGSDSYYDIHVAKSDGSGAVRVASTGNARQPAWSPDGRWIAFIDSVLYVVHPDGTGLRTLTRERTSYPAWSPDGSRISFTVGNDIYVMNLDGSGLRRLTDELDSTNGLLAWSPDGTRIAYTTGRDFGCNFFGCVRLWVMNADGTNKRRVSTREASNPKWAPDGSKIAFQAWGDVSPQIYTVNPDGTGETLLTDSRYGDYGTEWSPDSSRLLVNRSRAGSESEIWTVDRDGSDERFVATGDSGQWQPLLTGKAAKRFCKLQRRRLRDEAQGRSASRASRSAASCMKR